MNMLVLERRTRFKIFFQRNIDAGNAVKYSTIEEIYNIIYCTLIRIYEVQIYNRYHGKMMKAPLKIWLMVIGFKQLMMKIVLTF